LGVAPVSHVQIVGMKPPTIDSDDGHILSRTGSPLTSDTIDQFPAGYANRGQPVWEIGGDDYLSRQVFDLRVPMPLVVTERGAQCCRCAACGTATKTRNAEIVCDLPLAQTRPGRNGVRSDA
jgi:hypothetical protein